MADKKKKDVSKEEQLDKGLKDSMLEDYKKRVTEAETNLKIAEDEREDWKNKYYEAYADMANTRKQVEKEVSEFKKYAKQDLIEELIPTLDSFDMALKNEPDDPKIKSYVQGFKMIHSKLLNTLKQCHVEIIDPKLGDEYDPNTMQAYSTVEGEEDNKVADKFTKGYKLYDHLLRPAGVIITKKKEEEKVEESKEDSKEE